MAKTIRSAAWIVSIWLMLTHSGQLAALGTYSVVSSGALADGVLRTDGGMTAGSAVLTSASSLFSAADAGKYIQVVGAGPGGASRFDGGMTAGSAILTSASGSFTAADVGRGMVVTGAGEGGGNLVTTIQGYTSAASVSLSAPAQTAVNSAAYYYGAMTLEASIQSVQSTTSVTLSTAASASISSTVFAYGTDNHLAFQTALDTAGAAGGGQVNVPAPASCPAGAVCGYVIKASDQTTASAPGAVKIRYSNVQLVGDVAQTNLFCRGAYGTYSNTVAFPGAVGNIRGYCLSIGDNGGPNGASGESVSNVTISNLHLYGMTNGNTFRVNFAYPPTASDGWDITHKAIALWVGGVFSNIIIDSVAIQDFKAENIYSGGSAVSGMVIQNSSLTNFNGDGISMLAADLQVLNNTISNGSNAGIENSSASSGARMLVRQLYQGNHFSLFPNEAIAVVGVDSGVASGSVGISGNSFDTIGQMNPAGVRAAIEIGAQANATPPANVMVSANTCHDCYSFGVFQTSGNSIVEGNSFTVDKYRSNSVFSFNYPLSNVTVENNTGSFTASAAANPLGMLGDVYVLVPSGASGGYAWKNVILKGNNWTFAGARHYQFVTSSGPGWSLLAGDNLNWQGDVCSGCIHADADHGSINLTQTTLIEPYGPVVYLTGNGGAVTASVDASKEEDGAQLQLVNIGSAPVTFAPDSNLSLPGAYTLAGGGSGSLTLVYRAALGKYVLGNAAAAIAAVAGTPQSATVTNAFSTALQAKVTDANGYPMAGARVTFSAPAGDASASFSGSAAATAVTDASGIATAPAITANSHAGAYAVIVSVAGVNSGASFSLTNLAAASASVTNSGSLTGIGNSATTSANLTAEGVNDWVHWGDTSLTRKAGVAAQISNYVVVGSFQPLRFSNDPRTLSWTDGAPTASGSNKGGLYVNYKGGGFTLSVTADTATRILTLHLGGYNSSGMLKAHLSDSSAPDFVDNTTLSTVQYDRNYTLTYNAASAGQTLTVSWVNTANAGNLTLGGAALTQAGPSIAATLGTPQSTSVNTDFGVGLQATVKDAGSNPLSGVTVTFSAPASGASASFSGSATATALTNASGIATAPALTANGQAGAYTVTAAASGAASPASFNLANLAGAAAAITASAGTPQSASVSTAFTTALQATVKDASSNPVSGVTVTFSAPASGASASFSGSAMATAVTNASGVATAPALTANGQSGAYSLTATVPGVAAAATFSLTNLGGVPASVTATAGTPQSASVNTAFTTLLQATVKAANNSPVSGVTVTFSAPASGASASFGGSAAANAVTNASGVATAPALTANGQSGAYSLTATVSGVAAAASFSLTNLAGVPASVTATAGTPQSASVNTAFTTLLQATVKASDNSPVSGVTVTFNAPASGASASFGGSASATAITNANGIATAPAFSANSHAGGYAVVATVAGVAAGASFSLTNLAGAPASVTATAGTPQSAAVNTAFAAVLQATVKDAGSNPVSGVTVTFNAPASGASASFGGSAAATAITNASGIATAPTLTANGLAGAYSVIATAPGIAAAASFSLTNSAVTGGSGNLTGVGNSTTTTANLTAEGANDWVHWGDTALNRKAGVAAQIGNYAVVGAFQPVGYSNDPRTLSWTDGTPGATGSNNNGIYINNQGNGFSVSASADSVTRVLTVHVGGWLSSGMLTAHLSDASAADFVDNNTAVAGGQYDRNYTLTYNAASAGQTLTVTWISTSGTGNVTLNGAALTQAGVVITATAGTPQSASVNTAFGVALQATVKDAGNNPLSGVTVTFSAPASGVGALFSGSATATAITNASGIATAPVLIANGQAGAYTVTATAAGVATPAGFSLTNVAGAPAAITATGGTPQSAALNTAFASGLQATVRDASSNPVSGATVTFTAPGSGASASFGGSATATAATNASGVATAPALTANSQSGSYNVSATVPGVAAAASFSLTNLAGAPASIAATAGTPQSASVNAVFATALQATVKASNNTPVSGVSVTFAAPASGAGASFSGSATAIAVTNASGIATAPTLTANSQAGGYTLTASVSGVSGGASFSLTNLAGAAASITASAGTPQTTGLNAPFATNLLAVVKDAGSNPIGGVTVTFNAPGGGASATFGGSGSITTATALTNASGIATAPLLTANGQAGSFSVTATAPGVASTASFSLTNSNATPAAIKLVQKADVNSMINLPSETVSFRSGNSAGNWIGVVIFAGQSSSHTFTITDTNGNTYRQALTMGNTNESVTLGMFYAENIKAGPNQIKIVPNTAGYLRITILEYAGIATANSLDVTAAAQGNSLSPNSGTVTTSVSGDLLLGGSTTADAGVTAGPGYTLEDVIPASPGTRLTVEDRIQTSAGPASASLTLGATKDWTMGLAAFKSQ